MNLLTRIMTTAVILAAMPVFVIIMCACATFGSLKGCVDAIETVWTARR